MTFIKLFTAKVGLFADQTVQLVVKSNPTISNTFKMRGEDTLENNLKYEVTWYYDGNYKVVTGNESGFTGETLYDLLITSW